METENTASFGHHYNISFGMVGGQIFMEGGLPDDKIWQAHSV